MAASFTIDIFQKSLFGYIHVRAEESRAGIWLLHRAAAGGEFLGEARAAPVRA
jgi:hypothetical protein